MAAKQLTGIPLYFLSASFLFASKESSKEFSKVQEVDTQQMRHKHNLGIGGNIRQDAHAQPYPVSAVQNRSIFCYKGDCHYDRTNKGLAIKAQYFLTTSHTKHLHYPKKLLQA